MINDYKKVTDSITASEELRNNTIMKLKSKEKHNNNHSIKVINKKRRIYGYTSAAVFCLLIAAISIAAFHNSGSSSAPDYTIFKGQRMSTNSGNSKNDEIKKVKKYPQGSVQARIMTEEAISMDFNGVADLAGPLYKTIKDRYANSQNVIKGYVYSTEYFWYSSSDRSDLYTKSVIIIKKCYKGQLKPEDKITVIEHGGVTTLGEWIEKTSVKEYKSFEKKPESYDPYNGKSPNSLVEYAGFTGIPAMRAGQEVVLFLSADNYEFFGKNGPKGYRIIGFDGGKMVLQDGIYRAQISKNFQNIVKDESCVESEIDNLMKSLESSY